MASTFQQQSQMRKVVYTVLILLLFSATLLHRLYVIVPHAVRLSLRQENIGELELTGSTMRLLLTGSRGLIVTLLWNDAIQKQKKHEWNKLEARVRTLTKLQPHFITPWLFQSWNLAYNVSVEHDRIRDKYFYIARGIELLAEGERQNRGTILVNGETIRLNHPELSHNIGFYYQQKIGTHDNANTLLSLLQMSGIDPRRRDPNYLRRLDESGRPVVDLERFGEFCRNHPILVRRLREVLKYEKPDEIVDFLALNQKLPSWYVDNYVAPDGADRPTPWKAEHERFPVAAPLTEAELGKDGSPLEPDFSTFTAARGWFVYAQKPMPPPDPTFRKEPRDYDLTRYRLNKAMAHLIFRGYPARAQVYVADRLEQEGWFDTEGWRITGWFPNDQFRVERQLVPSVVGAEREWARQAWRAAHLLYVAHGERTGLYLSDVAEARLQQDAARYRSAFGLTADQQMVDVPAAQQDDAELMKGYWAAYQLMRYGHNRSMTNFPHFYTRSLVEQTEDTIGVRKAFFQADRFRRAAQAPRALQLYAETFPRWRDILLRDENKSFRRDPSIQEENYETQQRYLNLVRGDRRPVKELKLTGPEGRLLEDWRGPSLRNLLVLQEYLTRAAWPPPVVLAAVAPVHVSVIGPLDWKDKDGEPLISGTARSTVEGRR